MSSRSTAYAFQSIAASGLAVMNHRIAFQLRGDLWSDIQGCLFDFEKEQNIDGAKSSCGHPSPAMARFRSMPVPWTALRSA